MFSLKPKPKPEAQKNNNNAGNKQQNKQGNNKSKGHSKKVAKTVFEDPFYYRIELLPQEEAEQLQALLINYLKKLRQSMPYKPPRSGLTKTIKFEPDPKIKEKQSPLISPQIAVGIKRTRIIVYNNHKKIGKSTQVPHLTIIFYEQKKHQALEQLLCLLKITNSPYLIIRQNLEINRMLGMRTVGSICLFNQEFSNSLLKYIGKCLIDIPWLVNMEEVAFEKTDKMEQQ